MPPFFFAVEAAHNTDTDTDTSHLSVARAKTNTKNVSNQAADTPNAKRALGEDEDSHELAPGITKPKPKSIIDAPKPKRQRVTNQATSSSQNSIFSIGGSLQTNAAASSSASALVGTDWDELKKARKEALKVNKLSARDPNNKAPAPPEQLPPPIKIIYDGKVYDGIPQNDADSAKSSNPSSGLKKGISYKGWLNFEQAGYDYRTLNNKGEGGILLFPCTREQGRKNNFVDPSRVYTTEFQPWFKFAMNKSSGAPAFNFCTSDRSKKGAKAEADGENAEAAEEKETKATDKKSKASDKKTDDGKKAMKSQAGDKSSMETDPMEDVETEVAAESNNEVINKDGTGDKPDYTDYDFLFSF